MKILVTGGTVFVSKFTAQYFVKKGHEVFVLNRNTKQQIPGVSLISCDRYGLKDTLKEHHFDAVLDITSYDVEDVSVLLEGLGEFDNYILISSSAVYPETNEQPFVEEQTLGRNKFWGDYGTDKIKAEEFLMKKVPSAYIIRPPYLYGEMNNIYREAFVFDCAEQDKPFYVPKDGKLPLHFFNIEDLCRFMEILLEKKPEQKVYNVGNNEVVDICEWVRLCYEVVGKSPELKYVTEDINQRLYFPFADYAYVLDASKQRELLPDTKPLREGLQKAYKWYKTNRQEVRRKPLLEYIEENFV